MWNSSYIGKKDPVPILLKGLRRLEYRGYDSAGVALLNSESFKVLVLGKFLLLNHSLMILQLMVTGYCPY